MASNQIQTVNGTINGVNTAFTILNAINGKSFISLNGILYFEDTDYTLSGLNITYVTAPALDLAGSTHKLIPVGQTVPSTEGTNLLPYALTTLQRVKDRMFDVNTSATQPNVFDNVITRMINGVTDWFERETGGRRFVLTRYTNEVYSALGSRQKRIVLRQSPVFYQTVTGTTTAGSTSITSVSSTTGMVVGMPIAGDNIPGVYTSGANQIRNAITAISGSTVTIGSAATISGSSAYFTVNGLLNLQWRAGTPATNPSWFNFIPDQYDLINNGKAGTIRLYGYVPQTEDNSIRVTFYAGYPVNWTNAGDYSTHLLPIDISDMVENLVVRKFKRRILAGKMSEGLEGATTAWRDDLDADDRAVIDHYRRVPTII